MPASDAAFVLIQPDLPLKYPLLGILPWPATLALQGVAIVTAAVLIASLYFSRLPQDLSEMVAGALAGLRTATTDLWLSATATDGTAQPAAKPKAPRTRRGKPSQSGTGLAHAHRPAAQNDHNVGQCYRGLVNTGNTCFFNSVVQSLSSLPSFLANLQKLQEVAEECDVPTPVLDALLDLLTALNTAATRQERAIRPDPLTSALAARGRESSATLRSLVTAQQQQDSHELFVLLLDVLNGERQSVLDELSLEAENATSSHIFGGLAELIAGPNAQAPDSADCAYMVPGDRLRQESMQRNKLIRGPGNPFEGLVAQRTACLVCGYYDVIRHYPQEELSLSVPVTRWGSAGVSLLDCLADWARLDPVEWRCWACTLTFNISKLESDMRRAGAPLDGDPDTPALPNGSEASLQSSVKLSTSARKRLKETRKALAALRHARSHRLTEEDFRDEHPGIKVTLPPKTASMPTGATATKQTLFSRPPQALALHLNRSMYAGYGATKNDSRIAFGEFLDLSEVCLGSEGVESDPVRGMNQVRVDQSDESIRNGGEGWSVAGTRPNGLPDKRNDAETLSHGSNRHECQEATGLGNTPSPPVYRLSALVVHYGGHSFGHYVAYRRAPSRSHQGQAREALTGASRPDPWLRISDESVSYCQVGDALREGSGAVILFYERVTRSADGLELYKGEKIRVSPDSHLPVHTEVSSTTNLSEDALSASTLLRVHSTLAQANQRRQSRRFQGRCVERWQIDSRESTPISGI